MWYLFELHNQIIPIFHFLISSSGVNQIDVKMNVVLQTLANCQI